MMLLAKLALALVLILLAAGIVVYAMGSRLPENHVVYVSGIVAAPPEKVFALITDLKAQPHWRQNLVSNEILPVVNGQDRWLERYKQGDPMTFLAIETSAPARRVVKVEVSNDAYGGQWIYLLAPAGDGKTNVTITEDGYVRPPVYRFMMVHLLGADYNLKHYLSDLQAVATRP